MREEDLKLLHPQLLPVQENYKRNLTHKEKDEKLIKKNTHKSQLNLRKSLGNSGSEEQSKFLAKVPKFGLLCINYFNNIEVESEANWSKYEPPPSQVKDNILSNSFDENSDEDDISEFKTKDKIPKKRFFWRALNQGKIKWDLFIMLLATVNWFQVPYNVAFTDQESRSIFADLFNFSIDFIFMLDVVINFRTSIIIESTAVEIFDNKKIAQNYLRGRFWIDFPASIPFDLFTYIFPSMGGDQLTLQLVGLLKLVRVLRLSRLITYLNLKSELKMSLKLAKLIFFLILFLHWLGWVWFFIVKQNEKWLPPLDYVWIETDLYDQDKFFQYWNSLYHAILMLAGNDVGPRGSFQMCFVWITLLAGSIINANIFGNMAVILQSLNKKATSFQEKLDNANETMKNLKIPTDLQEEIKGFFTFTQNTQDHQSELKIFMETLSPSLKQKVIASIFQDVIATNTIFCKHISVINQILGNLETCLFLPENKIIAQGQEGNWLYFIAHGEWDVTVMTEKQKEIHVSTIGEGGYFGEVALLKKWKRTASVISKNYTTIARLRK